MVEETQQAEEEGLNAKTVGDQALRCFHNYTLLMFEIGRANRRHELADLK